MKRHASAKWEGGLKDGKGTLKTESKMLNETPYSFTTRFEDERGTNPEELIAAALAGCFTMALSGELEKKNISVDALHTSAYVTLAKNEQGFHIPNIDLNVQTHVSEADKQAFLESAHTAKNNCPVSKLMNATISLDIRLTH